MQTLKKEVNYCQWAFPLVDVRAVKKDLQVLVTLEDALCEASFLPSHFVFQTRSGSSRSTNTSLYTNEINSLQMTINCYFVCLDEFVAVLEIAALGSIKTLKEALSLGGFFVAIDWLEEAIDCPFDERRVALREIP